MLATIIESYNVSGFCKIFLVVWGICYLGLARDARNERGGGGMKSRSLQTH
jgi:hypothetical protein